VRRPRPTPAAEAGAGQLAGWIALDGRFYPAPQYHHIRVAHELRATGDGPADPWDMRDGWVMVKAHGEVLVLPRRVTQPQLDTLADMLIAAPDGPYRSWLLASLRRVRELEMCPERADYRST
jgi:hypothetical protein